MSTPLDSITPTPRRENRPLVCLKGIEKSFGETRVLKGVELEVRPGGILGLVGENGAGKSTLMNLLGGSLMPDSGRMTLNDEPYVPRHPQDARAAGIAFVHQELNLFQNLSIAENLHLTAFPRYGQGSGTRGASGVGLPFINRGRLNGQTRQLLQRVGLERDPSTLVDELSTGERQLVEIAKALGAEAQLIILDEPTTSLSSRECERLFVLLRELKTAGHGLIYISHTLSDVLSLCDELVVLRDGEVVGKGSRAAFTESKLVSLMVGRQLDQLYPSRSRPLGTDLTSTPPVRLEVQSITQPGVVEGILFTLGAGEILGIAGLMGAGRSELARILFGLDPFSEGKVLLDGRPLIGTPRDRIRQGLAFLTEDRRQEGLCLDASISDNLSLVALPAHARPPLGWLNFSAIHSSVERMRQAVRLSPQADTTQPVGVLSGGNQQKVVLGKWLLAQPRVLILDEPTRGVDVGAKFEIYQLIQQLADRGAGVLTISSEIEELMGLCDRILVMSQGRITGEFKREDFDRTQILAAALPTSAS